MDDIEGSRVTLTVDDGSDSPQVTASSDHTQVARIELDEVHDLVGRDVQLDSVVHLDQGIRVADRAAIVGGQEWDSLGPGLHTANLAELVLQGQRTLVITTVAEWQIETTVISLGNAEQPRF